MTTAEILAGENGRVVHRSMKPGPVVGHAPLKAGRNDDVTAILSEPVAAGDKLMLMLHSEPGGMPASSHTRSGPKEDGPICAEGG